MFGIFEAFEADPDYRTLVEATAEGWWYSARLPEARTAIAFMSDADLLPPQHPQLRAYWLRQLQGSVQTRARAAGRTLEHLMQPLRWVAAGSEILECSSGARWLAIGDAAVSFDPLSAQGIYHALRSGLLAVDTIEGALRGESGAVAEWSIRNRHSFEAYLRTGKPITTWNAGGLGPRSGGVGTDPPTYRLLALSSCTQTVEKKPLYFANEGPRL